LVLTFVKEVAAISYECQNRDTDDTTVTGWAHCRFRGPEYCAAGRPGL